MSPLLLILYAVVLVILAVAVLIMLNSVRSRGAIALSLDMTLLSFTLPRFSSTQQGEKAKQDKFLIQFLTPKRR